METVVYLLILCCVQCSYCGVCCTFQFS